MRAKPPSPAPWPPAETTQGDADLLSRIKRREPAALGELYDRYGKLAYAIILRIVSHQGTAEDLLAETFVTVWNQIARWKDARIEDLRLWLLLLARDHAVEYLRSRNEALPRALPHPNALLHPSVLLDFPRPRSAENWNELHNAFATMTEKESRTLEMVCFYGIAPSEIAATSGDSVAAIRDVLNEALFKLIGSSEKEPRLPDDL